MNAKKNPKADLESFRKLFFQFGLMLALGIVLLAFEWPTKDISVASINYTRGETEFDDELVRVIREPEVL